MSTQNKTIFCDIDGVILYQPQDFTRVCCGIEPPSATEGTINKLLDWHVKGYKVILVTGRPENMRKMTEQALSSQGVIYDLLIMGVGSGPRYLINDRDPKHPRH